MSVKIQTRSINPTVFNDLLTAGTDPLIARLCAARDVQSPAELDDKLAALLPYQTLTNCEAAAGRLADAVERQEKILIVADYDADGCDGVCRRYERFGGDGGESGFSCAQPL